MAITGGSEGCQQAATGSGPTRDRVEADVGDPYPPVITWQEPDRPGPPGTEAEKGRPPGLCLQASAPLPSASTRRTATDVLDSTWLTQTRSPRATGPSACADSFVGDPASRTTTSP